MKRRMLIIDVAGDALEPVLQKDPLPREFGLNLNTIAQARQWLTNPHNWKGSEVIPLKWDGLVPYICKRRGLRLAQEPWDDGLPTVVILEQRRLRRGGKEEEVHIDGE